MHKAIAAAAATMFVVAGCASMSAKEYRATTTLEPTTGNQASGTVTFVQRGNSVHVVADLRGLTPNAEHGFHVHEKGDCSSGDGMSAGDHFNPQGVGHGRDPGHAGDMPNLKADAKGNAKTAFDTSKMTVSEGKSSIVAKGLIVHKDPDDYKTQPAGNAGARVACGVIKST